MAAHMPRMFRVIGHEFNHKFSRKDAGSVNEFVGFQANGIVVPRDRRGTSRYTLAIFRTR